MAGGKRVWDVVGGGGVGGRGCKERVGAGHLPTTPVAGALRSLMVWAEIIGGERAWYVEKAGEGMFEVVGGRDTGIEWWRTSCARYWLSAGKHEEEGVPGVWVVMVVEQVGGRDREIEGELSGMSVLASETKNRAVRAQFSVWGVKIKVDSI